MQSEMPGLGSAHRKASQGDATVIDAEATFHVSNCFEDIDFTRLAIGVVCTAKHIELITKQSNMTKTERWRDVIAQSFLLSCIEVLLAAMSITDGSEFLICS